jgi:hypothetical protein
MTNVYVKPSVAVVSFNNGEGTNSITTLSSQGTTEARKGQLTKVTINLRR